MGAKLILADRGYDSEWTNDSDRTPFGITQTHYIQNHDEQQAEAAVQRSAWRTGPVGLDGRVYSFSSPRAVPTTPPSSRRSTTRAALLNFVANDGYTTDNQSAFVHVTYDFTERLRVSGGARYTDEEKTNTFDHGPALNRSDVPLVFGDSRSDWKVSVDFQLNDTMFLYAQSATGFTSEAATPRIFTVGQLMALAGRRAPEQRDRREARIPRQSPPPERRGVHERLRSACPADGRREPVRRAERAESGAVSARRRQLPGEHVVRRAERPAPSRVCRGSSTTTHPASSTATRSS